MPTTLEALVLLFVFSVPAYLSILVYKARSPVRYYQEKQSPIEQIALYLFLGTLVNVLTLSGFWLLFLLASSLHRVFSAGAKLAIDWSSITYEDWFLTGFPAIIVYCLLGGLFSLLVGGLLSRLLPEATPLWVTELSRLKAKQAGGQVGPVWMLVQLKNGDRCLGLVDEYQWIGEKENAIALALERVFYQLAGCDEKEEVGRLVIHSDEISWLNPYRS